ncbi:unnamed protein product [Diabrotica balteata]|uniref:Uncharacterized protein n=1 Tax=Diabrotica balteata TaxID=107213 RepID=A0A9N9X754_DIABA|nr:unnamed protein product [Diabrotica balteata]
MATDSTSLKSTSSSKPRTPGVDTGKKVGFARPTLIIPPPQAYYPPQFGAYTPGGISNHSHHSHGHPHYAYGRKASMFMMHQFDGIKDFAKSGLGIGEKCSYWCYGKVTKLSKKWFTHCFLSIVLGLYTVGGALLFMYVEDKDPEYMPNDKNGPIKKSKIACEIPSTLLDQNINEENLTRQTTTQHNKQLH